MHSMPELLLHELGDLLFAERTITKALPKMIREVAQPDMKARLEQHLEETQQQIGNLERAFAALGERAKPEKCPAILGLVKEHDDFKKEEEPSKPILEAFDLGSGLRVEHYEIAAYRTAIAIATNLGQQEVVDLLRQNLAQEEAMAEFIESNAAMALETARANAEAMPPRRATKQPAAKQGGGAPRGGATRGAAKGGARTGATKGATKGAAKGGAKQATAKKSSAKKGVAKKATAKRGARR